MNQTELTGRLTKELTLEMVGTNQTHKCEFTLAVNRDRPNKEGKYDADFIRCVAWNKTADFLCNYATKGTLIELVGAIRTGSYKDQTGNTVFTTKVFVETAKIDAGGIGKNTSEANAPVQAEQASAAPAVEEEYAEDVADVDVSAEDLPF